MKTRILKFSLLAMAILLTGCSQGKEEPVIKKDKDQEVTEESGYKDTSIAFIGGNIEDGMWKNFKTGAKDAAAEINLKKLDFIEATEGTQSKEIEKAIDKKYDAICIAPFETEASKNALVKANEKKIEIIGYGRTLSDNFSKALSTSLGGNELTFSKNDDYADGGLAGDYLYESVKEDVYANGHTGTLNVGILIENEASSTSKQHARGFIEKSVELFGKDLCAVIGFDEFNIENPQAKFTFKAVVVDKSLDETTQNNISGLLNESSTNAIFATNQSTSKNLLTVNKTLDKLGKEKILGIGFDAGVEQIEAIKNEVLKGSVIQNSYAMGYQAVMLAAGKVKDDNLFAIDPNAKWYDKDNMKNSDIAKLLYE